MLSIVKWNNVTGTIGSLNAGPSSDKRKSIYIAQSFVFNFTMASFRTISLGFPEWKIGVSTAVSGTLSVSLPDVEEYDIPIIIDKPLDMKVCMQPN